MILRAKGLDEKPVNMDLSLDTNIRNSSFKTHLHIKPAKLISQFVEELKKFGVSLEEFIGGRIFFQPRMCSEITSSRDFYPLLATTIMITYIPTKGHGKLRLSR